MPNADTRPTDATSALASELIERLFEGRSVRRVLLVAPPDVEAGAFNFAVCKRGRYTNYEPYGLGVLAGRLRAGGIAVDIVNLANAVLKAGRLADDEADFHYDSIWQDALDEALDHFRPDLVGVSCMFSQTHPIMAAVCRHVAARHPDLPIAAGGVHVTNALANAATRTALLDDLAPVSLFFRHECDEAFPDFIAVVNGEREAADGLAQLLLRVGDSEVDLTRRRPPGTESLNVLPAHDLMRPDDLSRWGKVGAYFYLRSPDTRFATVLSNRGCRAQCTFCSVRNFNGMGVRRRSAASVVDELEYLRDEFGVGHVMWLDDDFLYNRAATLALFEEMVRRNVGLTWDCTNGVIATSCDEEVVAAAAAAGCIGMSLGMESGNPEILRSIRKPSTVEKFLSAAEALHRHPTIYSRVFLIIGFPDETFAQIADTISIARQMDLDWYQIQLLQPLPNTPMFDSLAAKGLVKADDFVGVQYAGGTFGRNATRSAGGKDVLARDFEGIFGRHSADAVPDAEDLQDIWAYMVVHLNYLRLENKTDPIKLEQYLKNLEYVSDIVAPGDAIALHYRQVLSDRLGRPRDERLTGRLDQLMKTQPFWKDTFASLGLTLTERQ